MKNPVHSSHVSGAFVGAVAAWLLLWQGLGMVLPSTARDMSVSASREAVASAMAPACAEKYAASGGDYKKLASESSWKQSSTLVEGKFAPDSDTASKCLTLLANRK